MNAEPKKRSSEPCADFGSTKKLIGRAFKEARPCEDDSSDNCLGEGEKKSNLNSCDCLSLPTKWENYLPIQAADRVRIR